MSVEQKIHQYMYVSEKLSIHKNSVISFCSKYKIMSTWSETVAVTGDVREEVVKHVMLIVPHSFEQSIIGVLGKLLYKMQDAI